MTIAPAVEPGSLTQQWEEWLRYRITEPAALPTLRSLLSLGADPNGYNAPDRTPLGAVLRAAQKVPASSLGPWVEMVAALLEAGADPDLPGFPGQTPLSLAAALPSADGVSCLLAAGASVSPHPGLADPVAVAACNPHLPVLACLLEAGAPLDTPGPDGDGPLVAAIEKMKWLQARLLADKGASLGSFDALRRSVLCLTCQKNLNQEGVEFLFFLLDSGVPPNEPDILGRTPLTYLLAQLYVDTPTNLALVKKLLRAGADPRLVDHSGHDVFNVIQGRTGLPHTTALLRQWAVDLDARDLEQTTPGCLPGTSRPRF